MKILKLVLESLKFALNALKVNRLRTLLSLLGVTIGIFCVIGVLTLVDSLERSIRSSLDFLGEKTIYVMKWPWNFDNEEYPWWEYFNRPEANYEEYEFLKERIKNAIAVSIYTGRNTSVKQGSNSMDDAALIGVSEDYEKIFETPIQTGRYFSRVELQSARPVAVIGNDVKSSLFPGKENVQGEEIKIGGLKFQIVGVIEEQGESLIETDSNDEKVLIPFKLYSKLYLGRSRFGPSVQIALKGTEEDEGLEELESEIRGLLRAKRGLRPREDDDFALNRPEFLANVVSSIFGVLTLAGWIIGSFSMLVGGFGIANIMFVSVRERTNIIGIQKSLGAKNWFILSSFLFEAVFLSAVGGLVGLLLVSLLSFLPLGSLQIVMSLENILLGLFVSGIIGMVSGVIPAYRASRLNPVDAIRSK